MLGWREWVVLPALSVVPIKAKIDTGARTSSLHAFNLVEMDEGDRKLARFEIHPIQRSTALAGEVSAPIVGYKRVRSSTGHAQERPVIRVAARIGDDEFEIDLTLTSRDEMGFRMLLGRSAVRRRYWVDPGRSFLQSAGSEVEGGRQ